MRRGWTLLIPSGPSGKHLFFVLNDVPPAGELILAPLCSVRGRDGKTKKRVDKTCLLDVGVHPFVRHESYIEYFLLRSDPVAYIQEMLRRDHFVRREDASEELVEQIIDGACRSKRVPQRIFRLLFEVWD